MILRVIIVSLFLSLGHFFILRQPTLHLHGRHVLSPHFGSETYFYLKNKQI